MTKVLFCNPPWWVKDGDAPLRGGIRAGSRWPFTRETPYPPDKFKFGSYLPFPFFLTSAAGWMRQQCLWNMDLPSSARGFSVHVRDSIARGESYASFGKYLDELNPDWIVVETASSSWQHDKRILHQMYLLLPKVKFIVVGTITSGQHAADAVELEGVAAVVKGEYEKGCVRVVVGGERGIIPHDLLTREEMNGRFAEWPLWDEGAAKNYFDACPRGQVPTQLQMWASRGCMHVCQFCAWPATMTGNDPEGKGGRKVRFYSPQWVEGYIKHRQQVMGPLGCVYFDDDTFNLGDRHVAGICEVMARLKLPWFAMCRADSVSRETWKLMADSGCKGVKIGFESGSDRVVNRIIGKKLDLADASITARWLRTELGLTVHGTFMVGLPGETPEEAQMTVKFIERLYLLGALDTHQLSGTATLDGTPLANMREGEINPSFPDAIKDANFFESPDGQKKIETIQNRLMTI